MIYPPPCEQKKKDLTRVIEREASTDTTSSAQHTAAVLRSRTEMAMPWRCRWTRAWTQAMGVHHGKVSHTHACAVWHSLSALCSPLPPNM